MANYWQHRITGGDNAKKLAHPLLFQHRILSTGWARLSWDDFVRLSRGDWNIFIREFKNEYPTLGNFRSLWNFLEMQEGDVVVVPTDGEFSIYRVADNKVYTNESLSSIISKDKLLDAEGELAYVNIDKYGYSYLFDASGNFIDLGFYRKVEPICEHMDRNSCDDVLRNELSVPRTNINIDSIANHIDKFIRKNRMMPDIRLDRTFWPVGHGAFYTERFYDCVGKNLFTAVYDCGSGNRWLKTHNGQRYLSSPEVKNLIEGFMPPQYAPGSTVPIQDIDIAFISHLHADHINGFPVLLPRIKKLVLPQLTECKLLEAYLYNAFAMSIDENGEVIGEGVVDTESDVQRFIIRLAQREFRDNISIVEVSENEVSPEEGPVDIEEINGTIPGGSSLRVQIAPFAPIFWIYKPVNVDFSENKCKQIEQALEQYVPEHSLRGKDKKIDWGKVAVAVRKAGLKQIIEIYKTVFDIKDNSALHNSYSMPVYSGPTDFPVNAGVRVHLKSHIERPWRRAMLCEYDIFSHPFYPGPMSLGNRCKLLSCLYMGDFIASDDKKYNQLRGILGVYYDRVGIQQVPHHFSNQNRRAELYRGPLFAFGNVSGYRDRSFKSEVINDIVRFGCNPLVITKNIYTMVYFEYNIDIY